MKVCLRISGEQEAIYDTIEMIRGRLGIITDGWVPLDDYIDALQENEAVKEEGLVGQTDEEKRIALEHWPFDNHEENA